MTDRELMQQALDALEEISGGYSQNLIVALRERLAQPEQKPVAWIDEIIEDIHSLYDSEMIKELAEQAHCYACEYAQRPDYNPHNPYNQLIYKKRYDSKFAELIVRKCIQVCNSRVGNIDYNTGRTHCASDEDRALQALAQPEQEPVAFEEWLSKQHGDPEEIGFLQALRIAYISGQDSITTPFQRTWVGLTDEDKKTAVWTNGTFGAGALWAEAKLKEKNT